VRAEERSARPRRTWPGRPLQNGFSEATHAGVFEFGNLALRVGFEIAEHGQGPIGFLRAPESLERAKRAVRGASQTRVQCKRALVPAERFVQLAILRAALGNEVRGVRVAGGVLCSKREMRKRFARAAVVQEEQAQVVVGSHVVRVRPKYRFQDSARFDVIAGALAIENGNRKVDLQVALVRMRGGRSRERLARAREIELTHQPGAAILESDLVWGQRSRFAPRLARAGDGAQDEGEACRDRQSAHGRVIPDQISPGRRPCSGLPTG